MNNQMLPQNIDINYLPRLAKSMPKYSSIFLFIYQTDKYIKDIVTNVLDECDNTNDYYIKTELIHLSEYNLLLFNQDKMATMGTRWDMADLTQKAASKILEQDIVIRVKKIISELKNGNYIAQKDTINWVHGPI